jgi:hypothetical protein
VPIPHPLADNGPALVAAKALAIVDEVVAALTGDASDVAAAHRDRFQRLTQRRLQDGALCLDDACATDLALPSQAATPQATTPNAAVPIAR